MEGVTPTSFFKWCTEHESTLRKGSPTLVGKLFCRKFKLDPTKGKEIGFEVFKRYTEPLLPNKSEGNEKRLLKLYELYGPKWTLIAPLCSPDLDRKQAHIRYQLIQPSRIRFEEMSELQKETCCYWIAAFCDRHEGYHWQDWAKELLSLDIFGFGRGPGGNDLKTLYYHSRVFETWCTTQNRLDLLNYTYRARKGQSKLGFPLPKTPPVTSGTKRAREPKEPRAAKTKDPTSERQAKRSRKTPQEQTRYSYRIPHPVLTPQKYAALPTTAFKPITLPLPKPTTPPAPTNAAFPDDDLFFLSSSDDDTPPPPLSIPKAFDPVPPSFPSIHDPILSDNPFDEGAFQ